ncbi:MAG: NIL domain-containing protein [Candidatus Borkfalkiaceae bacterium]|nr:NIL domain-containing protein [Christensenellaceae bacterium]
MFNGAGAAGSPLIARMAVEKGIEANIAYASTKSIGGKAYGSMLLGINGDEETVAAAIRYLNDTTDVLAEEVKANV